MVVDGSDRTERLIVLVHRACLVRTQDFAFIFYFLLLLFCLAFTLVLLPHFFATRSTPPSFYAALLAVAPFLLPFAYLHFCTSACPPHLFLLLYSFLRSTTAHLLCGFRAPFVDVTRAVTPLLDRSALAGFCDYAATPAHYLARASAPPHTHAHLHYTLRHTHTAHLFALPLTHPGYCHAPHSPTLLLLHRVTRFARALHAVTRGITHRTHADPLNEWWWWLSITTPHCHAHVSFRHCTLWL